MVSGHLISFWLQLQWDLEEWDIHIFIIHHGNFWLEVEFDSCGLLNLQLQGVLFSWKLLLKVASVLL